MLKLLRDMFSFRLTMGLLLFLSFIGCSIIDTSKIPEEAENECLKGTASVYNIHTPPINENNKFVYVLIETGSQSSQDIIEENNSISTQLSEFIKPGDRLVVARMEKDSSVSSIIMDDVLEIAPPPGLPPTPESPIILPTLTPGGVQTELNLQIQTSEAIIESNQQNVMEYNCKIEEWNSSTNRVIENWEETKNNLKKEFLEDLDNYLLMNQIENEIEQDIVYESLSFASQFLQEELNQSEPGEFEESYLVIFSEMIDSRVNKPHDIEINLNGIRTIVLNEQCKYPIACEIRDHWENQMISFGAVNIAFDLNLSNESERIFRHCQETSAITPPTYNTYNFETNNPKYIYIIIDNSNNYSVHLSQSMGIISTAILTNLQPSDKLIFARMDLEPNIYSSILFNDLVPTIPPPRFPPTPNLLNEQSNTSNQNNTFEEKPCEVENWNRQSDAIFLEWQKEQQSIVTNFEEGARLQLSVPLSLTNGIRVYESLALASGFFSQEMHGERDYFSSYYLIIFSNLDDWRTTISGIDLQGVNVVVVTPCEFEQDCEIPRIWEPRFEGYGSNTLYFLTHDNNIPQAIENLLNSNDQ